MKIGFFDSGIGGLTVLYDALKVFPHAHFIYYADRKNIPYGNKSEKKIKKLTIASCNFLVEKKIDMLVIACNTATSVAIKSLRKKYDHIPIVGMEPAVKPATLLSNNKKIMVSATNYTLKAKKLHDLIEDTSSSNRVVKCSLQKLVKYAEAEDWHSDKLKAYLHKKLGEIHPSEYSSLVLGCTHFIFYRSQIREILHPDIHIIDGNEGTVNRMLSLLRNNPTPSTSKLSYYISGKKKKAKKLEPFLGYLKKMDVS